MTTTTLRNKLHDFINNADDERVKAVYSIFEEELTEKYDHWEDKDFLAEIENRIKDYENGKTAGVPWEEVQQIVKNRLQLKS